MSAIGNHATEGVRLFDLPQTEARRHLAGGAPVYLTVNPVEYHGPHLSLHNDRLISLGLIRAMHPLVAPEHPLLLADDVEVGVDPCPGPGTRYTTLPLARRVVKQACDALAELGAQRVVIMTFHGSPLHAQAIEAGLRRLQRRGLAAINPFNLLLRTLLDLDPARLAEALAEVPDPVDRAKIIEDFPTDFHAGFGETSLSLHLAPASVHPGHVHLPPCPPVRPWRLFAGLARLANVLGAHTLSRELSFIAVGLGWYDLKPFPAYTSRPHLASAAVGAQLTRLIVQDAAPLVRAALFERGPSPKPILGWLRWLSLDGRIGGAKRRQDQVLQPSEAFLAAWPGEPNAPTPAGP